MKTIILPGLSMEMAASAAIANDAISLDRRNLTSTRILSCRSATTQGEARIDADLFYLSSAKADVSMLRASSLDPVSNANGHDFCQQKSDVSRWMRNLTKGNTTFMHSTDPPCLGMEMAASAAIKVPIASAGGRFGSNRVHRNAV